MRSSDAEVELEALMPDDPLTNSPTMPSPPTAGPTTIPKWLQPQRRSNLYHKLSTSLQPFFSRFLIFIKPRLTWRYILFSSITLYTFYCLLTWQPLFASKLPPYTGPHGVGAIDVEIPLKKTKSVSPAVFKSTNEPAFDVESVLLTIYYPTSKSFRSKKPRLYWIPKPVSLTAEGYASIAHVNNFLIQPIFTFALWVIGSSLTIPAEVDAPLLDSDEKFPVMVFSHGMASSRTDYTNFLGELASRGLVTAAIEHRDGSSPGSFIKLNAEETGRRRLAFSKSDLKDKMDTSDFKKAQLAFRDAEILEAVHLLTTINAGSPVNTTRAPITTLPSFTGKLNTTSLTIGGHSYGATGALQAPSTVIPTAKSTLILDPGKSSGKLNHNLTIPSLVIHSNSWSKSVSMFHGRPHFETVRDLVRGIPAPSWFLTSLHTSHPSVTDASLIEPFLLSWATGAGMDAKGALREYVSAADEFLKYVNGGEVGELLREKVTHETYGVWINDERKKEFPKDLAKYWEVHVAPDETKKSI